MSVLTFTRGVTISGERCFLSAGFSADGNAVVATTRAGRQAWNPRTGEPLDAALVPNDEHASAPVSAQWRAGAKDSGASAPGFHVQDQAGAVGFIAEPFPDYAGATVAPDGKTVAIGYQHGRLRIETLPVSSPTFLVGHDRSKNNHQYQNVINYLAFDCDSQLLVSMADDDDRPLLWDLRQTPQSTTWNGKPAHALHDPIDLNSVTDGGVDTFRFSPVAPMFVCTHRRLQTLQIWTYARAAR
ncbi:MAG: WD40 repeat domain-containing protein [Pseudomonadota bacterium]